MTEEELDRLQKLVDSTSPGPWFSHPVTGLLCWGDPKDDRDNYDLDNPEDDDFIVAARTAIPQLIAEVRRLRQQITGHGDRLAAQSELLSKRAEKP